MWYWIVSIIYNIGCSHMTRTKARMTTPSTPWNPSEANMMVCSRPWWQAPASLLLRRRMAQHHCPQPRWAMVPYHSRDSPHRCLRLSMAKYGIDPDSSAPEVQHHLSGSICCLVICILAILHSTEPGRERNTMQNGTIETFRISLRACFPATMRLFEDFL